MNDANHIREHRDFNRTLYILTVVVAVITPLGFFLTYAYDGKYNQDEFQHVYLAWAWTYFGQIPFRDVFDNHGIIFPILNSLVLKALGPAPGIETLTQLRVMSLLLCSGCFVLCFRIVFRCSDDRFSAILTPLVFSYSYGTDYAFQIRPDTIQQLLMLVGIAFLVEYIRSERNYYLAWAGFFLSLMVASNTKSLIVVFAVAGSLPISFKITGSKFSHRRFLSLLKGFCAGLLIIVLALISLGALTNYLRYNFVYNYILTLDPSKDRPLKWLLSSYFGGNTFLTTLMITSLMLWLLFGLRKNLPQRRRIAFLTIGLLSLCLLAGKIIGLHLQYDLVFKFLMSAITSWVVWSLGKLLLNVVRIPARLRKPIAVGLLSVGFLCVGLHGLKTMQKSRPVRIRRMKLFQEQFNSIQKTMALSETVEAFVSKCPGMGFFRHASPYIMKYDSMMRAFEALDGKDIFGKPYIELLERKRVRYLFTKGEWFKSFSPATRSYIYANYRRDGCRWIRKSPFKPW